MGKHTESCQGQPGCCCCCCCNRSVCHCYCRCCCCACCCRPRCSSVDNLSKPGHQDGSFDPVDGAFSAANASLRAFWHSSRIVKGRNPIGCGFHVQTAFRSQAAACIAWILAAAAIAFQEELPNTTQVKTEREDAAECSSSRQALVVGRFSGPVSSSNVTKRSGNTDSMRDNRSVFSRSRWEWRPVVPTSPLSLSSSVTSCSPCLSSASSTSSVQSPPTTSSVVVWCGPAKTGATDIADHTHPSKSSVASVPLASLLPSLASYRLTEEDCSPQKEHEKGLLTDLNGTTEKTQHNTLLNEQLESPGEWTDLASVALHLAPNPAIEILRSDLSGAEDSGEEQVAQPVPMQTDTANSTKNFKEAIDAVPECLCASPNNLSVQTQVPNNIIPQNSAENSVLSTSAHDKKDEMNHPTFEFVLFHTQTPESSVLMKAAAPSGRPPLALSRNKKKHLKKKQRKMKVQPSSTTLKLKSVKELYSQSSVAEDAQMNKKRARRDLDAPSGDLEHHFHIGRLERFQTLKGDLEEEVEIVETDFEFEADSEDSHR